MIIGSFASLISITLGSLADAQNLIAKETPIQIANVIMTIVAVLIGSMWGLTGIATAIAVKAFVLLLFMKNMLQRSHLRLGWPLLFKSVGPVVSATLISAAGALLVTSQIGLAKTSIEYLLVLSAVVSLSYAVAWYLIAKRQRNNAGLQTSLELATSILKSMFRASVSLQRPK